MNSRIGRWIALLAAFGAAAAMAGGVDFPHGEAWGRRLAAPDGFVFERKVEKVKSEERDGFTLETWRQANGPKSFQLVLVAVPKATGSPMPAVVVPDLRPKLMFSERRRNAPGPKILSPVQRRRPPC